MSEKTYGDSHIAPSYTKTTLCDSPFGGLTKREYFAALALQGLMVNESIDGTANWTAGRNEKLAVRAVEQADSLIHALNRSETQIQKT